MNYYFIKIFEFTDQGGESLLLESPPARSICSIQWSSAYSLFSHIVYLLCPQHHLIFYSFNCTCCEAQMRSVAELLSYQYSIRWLLRQFFLGSCVPVVSVGQESLFGKQQLFYLYTSCSLRRWLICLQSVTGYVVPQVQTRFIMCFPGQSQNIDQSFQFLQGFLYKWLYVEFSSEFLYAICFLRDASSGEIIQGLMTVQRKEDIPTLFPS